MHKNTKKTIYTLLIFATLSGIGIFNKKCTDNMRSKLENLADTNKDGKIDVDEKLILYYICGEGDTSKILHSYQLKKGFKYFESKVSKPNN